MEKRKVLAKTKKIMFFTVTCFLLISTLNCSSTTNDNVNSIHNDSNTQNLPNRDTTAVVFDSGGIGLDRKEWEQNYGFGMRTLTRTRTSTIEEGYKYNRNDKCLTVYYSASDRITAIERDWGCFIFDGVNTSVAEEESKNFLPADAKELYSSSSPGKVAITKTVFYKSESLKSRFSASDFPEGKSGCITIVFSNQVLTEKKTTSYSISLGSNKYCADD